MGMKEGDCVVFEYETTDPGIVYFYIDKSGVPVKKHSSGRTTIFCVYSLEIIEHVCEFLKLKAIESLTKHMNSFSVEVKNL